MHTVSYNGSHLDLCDVALTSFACEGRLWDSDPCQLPPSPPPPAPSALPSPPPQAPVSRFTSVFAAPDPDHDRREVYLLLDHLYRGGGADTFLGGSVRSGSRRHSAEAATRSWEVDISGRSPFVGLKAVDTASRSGSDVSR